MDYSRFINDIGKRRKATILRDLFNLQVNAGDDWVFNIGGLPNESLFPLTRGELTMTNGTKITLDEDLMRECLQYGPSGGYPPLVKEVIAMVKKYHNPPCWEKRGMLITDGVQDGLAKAFDLILEEGDYVLMEEPAYSAVLSIMNPYTPKYIPLETDDRGLKPESLRAALSRWCPEEMSKAQKGVPKFFYTNPNGCNPSGTTLPEDRRREIYNICCQYNLLIIEDDPYYFQQYVPEEEYPPSFLQIDTQCRVLRLESFSKTVGGGLRLAYALGPKLIIDKMTIVQQTSSQHSSNFSQVILTQLLRSWGEAGFASHVKTSKEFYQKRRDQVLLLAEKHLKGLCEWKTPAGGLFLWIKVKDVPDVWEMIMQRGPAKKVILVPGNCFMTDSSKPCSFVRIAFSHVPTDKIDETFKRFAEMIREEINLKKSIQM